jgi:glycosyltransferase involved in cell wall biosynthesis
VIGAEDIGPLTKLTAAKDLSLADDDLIVTVDDDIVYEPGWLAALVAEAERRPDEAVGFAGWNVPRFFEPPAKYEGHTSKLFDLVHQPAYCDVLEGWAGVAYRRGFFDVDIFAPDEVMRKQDDVLISAYLNRNGIKRYAFRRPMCKADNRPGIHNRPDFVQICREAVIKGFQGERRLGTGEGQ